MKKCLFVTYNVLLITLNILNIILAKTTYLCLRERVYGVLDVELSLLTLQEPFLAINPPAVRGRVRGGLCGGA